MHVSLQEHSFDTVERLYDVGSVKMFLRPLTVCGCCDKFSEVLMVTFSYNQTKR